MREGMSSRYPMRNINLPNFASKILKFTLIQIFFFVVGFVPGVHFS